MLRVMLLSRHSVFVISLITLALASSLIFVGAKQAAPMLLNSVDDLVHYSIPEVFLSDEWAMFYYEQGLAKLQEEDKAVLSRFDESDILSVVRGTDKGKALVAKMTREESEAADLLLHEISVDITSDDGTPMSGIWPGSTAPTRPGGTPSLTPPPCPPITGSCTAGFTTCREYVSIPTGRGQLSRAFACQYGCFVAAGTPPGTAGVWDAGFECPWATCHTSQTCT